MLQLVTILAQAEPPAAALAQWLQVLMYLGGFACTVIGAAVGVKMLRAPQQQQTIVSPVPLEVREHTSAATAQQLKEVHGRIARERVEIDRAIEERRQEAAKLSAKLDTEIKGLRDELIEIPERTIDLLRKTKDLI